MISDSVLNLFKDVICVKTLKKLVYVDLLIHRRPFLPIFSLALQFLVKHMIYPEIMLSIYVEDVSTSSTSARTTPNKWGDLISYSVLSHNMLGYFYIF